MCGWASVPLFARVSTLVGVWGLVGLLFEICIVDASIYNMCAWSSAPWWGGTWVWVLLEQFSKLSRVWALRGSGVWGFV